MSPLRLFLSILLYGSLCFANLLHQRAAIDQLIGFGNATTGGAGGSETIARSCLELTQALGILGVIHIDGQLSGCGILTVGSDTTILGAGKLSGLTGGGLKLKSVDNVVIRNLNFHLAPLGRDIIVLENATNVWIDHNEFSSEGIVGNKDKYDGMLDISHGSDLVTVSWNKFSNHVCPRALTFYIPLTISSGKDH
jgi:pectate lyase